MYWHCVHTMFVLEKNLVLSFHVVCALPSSAGSIDNIHNTGNTISAIPIISAIPVFRLSFTAWCRYYSAKHSVAIASRPSVGLSVRSSVCNVGGSPASRYYGGHIGTLLRIVGLPFPTTYAPPLSLDWRAPKTPIAIISRTGKFTDFNFGWYINSLHANETSLKILEKRVHGRIQGCSFFG